MASEILKHDENAIRVLGGITDDVFQEIRMLRVDPATNRLLVSGTGGGGGSGFQSPLTGSVDGVNRTFTWTTAPSAITVDGATLQKTEQGSFSTVNWSGTTTTVMAVAPTQSIFAVA